MMRCCLAFLLVMLACGCSRSVEWLDARDRAEPMLKRARAKRNEGDIDGAIALYHEALRTDQRMALASLDLALLLHDEKKDYLGALCHYTRYLEARPETDKSEMIKKRRQLVLQSLIAAAAPRTGVPGGSSVAKAGAATGKENAELVSALQQLRKAQDKLKSSTARIDQLTQNNAELQSMLRRLQSELDQMKVMHSIATPSGSDTDKPASGRRVKKRTYAVVSGDSLSSIASAVYGDGAKWRTIYDANKEVLGGSQRLKVGQVLVIP